MKVPSLKSRCRIALQFVVVGTLAVGSMLACDCIAPPVREEARRKAAVFTGKVSEKIELPQMNGGRRRYEVHFSVTKQWKGSLPSEVVIYDAEPGAIAKDLVLKVAKSTLYSYEAGLSLGPAR